MQNTQSIKEKLRDLWKENNWAEFDRLFNLGKWMLPKEDQEKIQAAVDKRKGIIRSLPPGEQLDLVKYALEVMPGSKIVDKID